MNQTFSLIELKLLNILIYILLPLICFNVLTVITFPKFSVSRDENTVFKKNVFFKFICIIFKTLRKYNKSKSNSNVRLKEYKIKLLQVTGFKIKEKINW